MTKKNSESYFLEYMDYPGKNKANIVTYWCCTLGVFFIEISGLIMHFNADYVSYVPHNEFILVYVIIPICIYTVLGVINTAVYLILNKKHPVFVAYSATIFLLVMVTAVVAIHMLPTIFATWAVITALSLMYNDRKLTFITAMLGICFYVLIVFAWTPIDNHTVTHDVIDMSANIIFLLMTWFAGTHLLNSYEKLIIKIVSTEIQKNVLEQKLKRDSLTNLYNHAAFYVNLDEMIIKNKSDNAPFSLVVFDIDNFKSVNDTYGHAFGDKVILGISNVLRSYDDDTILPHRYGGEEFTLIVRSNADKAREIAEEIRVKFSEISYYNDRQFADPIHFTVSGGVSEWDNTYGGKREFFASADEALYEAKRTGKNKIIDCRDLIRNETAPQILSSEVQLQFLSPTAVQKFGDSSCRGGTKCENG